MSGVKSLYSEDIWLSLSKFLPAIAQRRNGYLGAMLCEKYFVTSFPVKPVAPHRTTSKPLEAAAELIARSPVICGLDNVVARRAGLCEHLLVFAERLAAA